MNIHDLCKLMHSLVIKKGDEKYLVKLSYLYDDSVWLDSFYSDWDKETFYICMLCNARVVRNNHNDHEKIITKHAIEHLKEYNLLMLV